MKPAAGLDISKQHVAAVRGEEVQPLSQLAARADDERAEHFEFEPQDQDLLDDVLADTEH